mgnify:CR=1 FL=1
MHTADFVAMQMTKRFTARKIPDRKHVRYCRKNSRRYLSLGFEPAHAGAAFNANWFYEGYERFRARPDSYYVNAVLPWETILEYI